MIGFRKSVKPILFKLDFKIWYYSFNTVIQIALWAFRFILVLMILGFFFLKNRTTFQCLLVVSNKIIIGYIHRLIYSYFSTVLSSSINILPRCFLLQPGPQPPRHHKSSSASTLELFLSIFSSTTANTSFSAFTDKLLNGQFITIIGLSIRLNQRPSSKIGTV